MVVSKYKLPNNNVIIWLGKGGSWGESEVFDNVLITSGGDVLVLKTTNVIRLNDSNVKEDIKKLGFREFIKKYGFIDNQELWTDLKEGVEKGKYPPFQDKEWVQDFLQMIQSYLFYLPEKDKNELLQLLKRQLKQV